MQSTPTQQKAQKDIRSGIREKLASEISEGALPSIVTLIDHLVELAYHAKASDIHIDPQAQSLRVRLRIDGILQDEPQWPKSIQGEIISRIKILANLRTDEHQVPQDGRFRATLEDGA